MKQKSKARIVPVLLINGRSFGFSLPVDICRTYNIDSNSHVVITGSDKEIHVKKLGIED